MQRISIKRPSDKVISRMRNLHPVRLVSGTGLDIMLKPETIAKIAKKFNIGKGIQISLDPDEIEASREVEGCGIFGKKFDKALKKTGIKKAVYAVGSVAKPFVQEGINAMEQMAVAYGVPPSIASKIGATATQYVDDPKSLQGKKGLRELKKRGLELGQEVSDMATNELGMDKVDVNSIVKKATPQKMKEMAKQTMGEFRQDARQSAENFQTSARQSLADKLEMRFRDVPQGNGLYAGRGIGLGVMSRARKAMKGSTGDIRSILSSTKNELTNRVDDLKRLVKSAPELRSQVMTTPSLMGTGMNIRKMIRDKHDMQQMSGNGVHTNFRRPVFAERTLSGRNSLIGGAMMPQALQSQPYSENFQFRATLGLMR